MTIRKSMFIVFATLFAFFLIYDRLVKSAFESSIANEAIWYNVLFNYT